MLLSVDLPPESKPKAMSTFTYSMPTAPHSIFRLKKTMKSVKLDLISQYEREKLAAEVFKMKVGNECHNVLDCYIDPFIVVPSHDVHLAPTPCVFFAKLVTSTRNNLQKANSENK